MIISCGLIFWIYLLSPNFFTGTITDNKDIFIWNIVFFFVNINIDKIILLNRRNIYKDLSPKIEERIVNFSHLKKENFQGCFQSSVFCCIGSTLSKVSKEEFEFIEKDLIVECGKFFKNLGCLHFHLVSSSTFLSRFWAGSGLFLSWF